MYSAYTLMLSSKTNNLFEKKFGKSFSVISSPKHFALAVVICRNDVCMWMLTVINGEIFYWHFSSPSVPIKMLSEKSVHLFYLLFNSYSFSQFIQHFFLITFFTFWNLRRLQTKMLRATSVKKIKIVKVSVILPQTYNPTAQVSV